MVFKMVIRYTIKIFFAASFITGITQILELSEIIFFCLHSCFFLYIEMNNNIHTVQSESSGVKMTRFQIEGWLKLIGTPSVDILHPLDCALICCLLSQLQTFTTWSQTIFNCSITKWLLESCQGDLYDCLSQINNVDCIFCNKITHYT